MSIYFSIKVWRFSFSLSVNGAYGKAQSDADTRNHDDFRPRRLDGLSHLSRPHGTTLVFTT